MQNQLSSPKDERCFVAIELKPIPDEDLEAFFIMMNDPTLSPHTGTVPHPIDVQWARARLIDKRLKEANGEGADRGLYKEGVLVGNAGWFLNEEGGAEIGYAIHRDHRGQGLATIAAQSVMHMMLAGGHKGPIYAQYFQDNPASGRVLEKLGFKRVHEIESQSAGRRSSAMAWVMMLEPTQQGESL